MLVPKLRFKEFNNEWISKKLGDICTIVSGGTPDTTKLEYWNGNINWFTPSEIKENKYVVNSNRKITKLGLNNSSASILPKNSILLTSRASIGEMAINTIECTTNQGFQSLIVNNAITDFVYYYQVKIKKYCLTHSAGSTFLEINKKLISKCEIYLPSLEEQTKIANFLSLIDRKIELQEKLVENLKLYKKGLLKKVFSNNQGWKSAKLGNIFQYEQPNNYIVENAEYNSNYTIPVLTANKGFILGYTNETNTYNKGKCIIFDDFTMDFKYVDFPFKVKSSAIKILTTKKEYNINFMYQLLKTITLEPISHQRHYISMVQNIEVTIPSIEEQNRIANLFTSLDKKIELETKKLQDLKTYKKGLLQKMFI